MRLFGHDLENLYPNPRGSHGKTVQSRVDCDNPDLKAYPNFPQAVCQSCILEPGEMLFIPAFYWHQVSALDTGLSVNFFYGDGGDSFYLEKILQPPYRPHFSYWLTNIIEQNRECESFERMLNRLDEVLRHFFLKQWHETALDSQIQTVIDEIVVPYLKFDQSPIGRFDDTAKFPPVLKIRGLLFRDGNKTSKKPDAKMDICDN